MTGNNDIGRTLDIRGLKQGSYTLFIKDYLPTPLSQQSHTNYTRYNIVVAKGLILMNEYCMEKRRFVEIETINKKKNLQIINVQRRTIQNEQKEQKEEQKDNKDKQEVEITLSGYTDKTRVHVIASYFVPDYSLADKVNRLPSTPTLQYYQKLPSSYFPQKSLGDEFNYILNRQLAAKRIGNMLNRPSLHLFQRVKQTTHFDDDPTLSTGEQYTASDIISLPSAELYAAAPPPAAGYAYNGPNTPRACMVMSTTSSSHSVSGQRERRNIEFLSQPSSM